MCEDFGSSLNALPDGEIGLITNVCRSTDTPEVYMFVMVWMRAAPVHGTIILSPALYHAIQLAIIVY
jgi:hypothetical protein